MRSLTGDWTRPALEASTLQVGYRGGGVYNINPTYISYFSDLYSYRFYPFMKNQLFQKKKVQTSCASLISTNIQKIQLSRNYS